MKSNGNHFLCVKERYEKIRNENHIPFGGEEFDIIGEYLSEGVCLFRGGENYILENIDNYTNQRGI